MRPVRDWELWVLVVLSVSLIFLAVWGFVDLVERAGAAF